MRGALALFIRRCGVLPIAAVAIAAANCIAADLAATKAPQIVAQPASPAKRLDARAASATERLLNDARDGQLNDFTFLGAALTASGTDKSTELTKWLDRYEPVRAGILKSVPAGTLTDRLKAIHAAAHRFVLNGTFQESCSDLRKTFASGDFNCLTSLVVCLDLCQGAGLNVQTRLTRGHVLLSFQNASGLRQAFEPGTAEWHVHPIVDTTSNRSLSQIELLGKLYYNRGVEQLRSGMYQNGLSLLQTSLALDPADEDARANLVAGLNNWAVQRCRDDQYADAASLIEQGLALDPSFAPLISNEQLVRAKLAK